ncbi:Aspartate aminotransferase [Lachnospiraceae bacterium TWA4]|nr:Aspartate aminotransferase [Lachnospiraceae bacterium TWA4]
MNYDFDKMVNRRGTNSLKWNVDENELPMWVACTYIQKKLPELYVVPSEATYLLWIDCSRITKDTKALADKIREITGLYLSEGSQYGSNGNEFLRLNVACPREQLYDGLERLRMGIEG